MYIYLLILRILHIGCGILWAGTAMFMVFYIFPAVVRSGPDGGKIMQAITGTNKFPLFLVLVSATTVVTGILLLWHLSNGFNPSFFTTKYGIALATGGIVAIVAFLQASIINRPAVLRIETISAGILKRGGSPSESERTELLAIRNKLITSTRLIAFWLFIAIVTMAGARYF